MSHCVVIIPTKNGMGTLPSVLDAVARQQTCWPFETLLIDSGSTDGISEEAARRGVSFLSIPSEDFGHGKTRNQAISKTTAPFVVLLTQDAVPADEFWLQNLVDAVEQRGDIGGAFGRHIAHEGADPFTRRDLEVHFDGFCNQPTIVSRETDAERYARDEGWRQMIHFFSDNNACLRRSVWEKISYPDVEFGEDQLWAKLMIEAGYSKAYAHGAVVRHSHQFTHWERLKRSFQESRYFHECFGYELTCGLRDFWKNLESRIRQDLWNWRRGAVRASFGELTNRMIANAFHQAGQYLGTNHARIPDWGVRMLSPY